jgi:hypothetical protein
MGRPVKSVIRKHARVMPGSVGIWPRSLHQLKVQKNRSKNLEEKTHINKFGRPAETQEVIIFKYHTYIYREKSGDKTPQSHVLQTSNRNHTETNLL